MVEITVRGTMQQVLNDLYRIKDVDTARKLTGWPVFFRDEQWRYIPEDWGLRLCPVCRAFASKKFYSGNEIMTNFPMVSLDVNFNLNFTAYPRVHKDPKHSHLKGKCRCRVVLQQPASTMLRRLHEEQLARTVHTRG